jgi:type I restriction enzyme S subunit
VISRNSINGRFPTTRLAEVVEFLDNQRRPVTESDRSAGPYPYYGANGQQGTIDDFIFDEPLLLLAEDGGHFGEPDRGIAYRISGKTWVNNHAHVLRPRPSVDLAYLCRVLENYDVTPFVTGTTRGKLTKAGASEIVIPLPALVEQRRIAEVLDRAEALRAKRRATLAQLDSLTQSLFLHVFGDPASGTTRHPAQQLESVLSRPLQNGAYFPKESYCAEGGVEMVHMSDAFYEIVVRGNLKRVSCSRGDIQKYSVTETDILVARRSLNYEGAAKPCLIPASNEALIFESSFIRATPRPDIVTVLYLYHYLSNERVRRKAVYPLVTQSTISGINQSNLARIPVLVPAMNLQREFARRVAAVEKLKIAQHASLAELHALFASLQHRAFRGEL